MTASSAAGESTYAGIVRLVTAAQTAKAPFVRLADRYALIFLPVLGGFFGKTPERNEKHEKAIEDMNRELKVGESQFHALLDKKLDNSMAKGFEQSARLAF